MTDGHGATAAGAVEAIEGSIPMGDAPARGGTRLPRWQSVLAVVAHPDDESFGLGAVLSAFVSNGSSVAVVSLTQGEASTLGPGTDDLAALRRREFAAAAGVLGVSASHLAAYPDGDLQSVTLPQLCREVLGFAAGREPDGILAFDPSGVTGHPDHRQATEVAIRVGETLGVGVLGWTLPASVVTTLRRESGIRLHGHEAQDIDITIEVDRGVQLDAVACHPSQALPSSVLWRRLDLLDDHEHLRWLYHPGPVVPAAPWARRADTPS